LSALGVSEDEAKTLTAAAKAGDLEATGEAVGDAVKAAGGGKLTLTKNGHLFICTSPCTVLRERYLDILAKDEGLEKELAELETRAKGIAGKEGPEVDALAEQVKKDAAALEGKLRAQQVESGIKALASKYKILQDLGLDSAAVERVLAKKTVDHMKGQ